MIRFSGARICAQPLAASQQAHYRDALRSGTQASKFRKHTTAETDEFTRALAGVQPVEAAEGSDEQRASTGLSAADLDRCESPVASSRGPRSSIASV